MTYAFERTKIPRTLAFPLKRSALDVALQRAGVEHLAVVYFTTRQRGDVVVRAEFVGEHRQGWQGAGKATITQYAVPLAEHRLTQAALLNGPLDHVCEWLRKSELAGNAWREADHLLEVRYAAGQVAVDEH